MRLLVIDDEESIRKATVATLEALGHETTCADSGSAAFKQLDSAVFDVAFLDLKLRGESGLDLLPKLAASAPHLDIVVFTAFSSVETAVEAMRLGAADYMGKPFTPQQIRKVLDRLIKTRKLEGRVAELESRLSSDAPTADFTTNEPAMQKAYETALKAANTPATVLLLGESGTGKTVLARVIHTNSPQRDNAFVTVSCPSLSRDLIASELFGHVKGSFTGAAADTWGKVAVADGGTLFLDEIGDVPIEIQPKLLRLLQEREYERVGEAKTRRANVRVIAATNRNLAQAVKAGHFRDDLYHRLDVISITLPPLRDRNSDLMHIASDCLRFFAVQCGKRMRGFSTEAQRAMEQYGWPGNLRELRNVVERAVILAGGDLIAADDLPERLSRPPMPEPSTGIEIGGRVSLEEIENEHIRHVVNRSATLDEAAQILGIDPATLYRKRKKLAI